MVQLMCSRSVITICLPLQSALISLIVVCSYDFALGITKKGVDNILFDESCETFEGLVVNNLFVDKSLLISDILNRDEKVFQITRPMKWGKTVNLQMLKRFFEVELDELGNEIPDGRKVNHLLFDGGRIKSRDGNLSRKPLKITAIKNSTKHFGKHPVIYLDLKNIGGNTKEEFDKSLKNEIVKLFLGHPFLEKYLANESDLLDEDEKLRLNNFVSNTLRGEYVLDALEFLSMLLYEHFHSYVCLLVDNYDYPLINTFLKFGDRGELFQYVKEMFWHLYEYAFKENQHLLKAVITGTLNFDIVPSGESEFFTYKYILYNTLVDEPFSTFYGFFEEEIVQLLQGQNKSVDVSKLKEWYGGFLLHGKGIYNPMSVIKYIASGDNKFNYFLHNSGKTVLTQFLDRGFLCDSMQEDFHLMSEGHQIITFGFEKAVNFKNISGDFYSLFCHAGYMYPIPPRRATPKPIWRFIVPNYESRGIIASGLRHWVRKELNISFFEYNQLADLLLDHKVDEFASKLQDILTRVGTYNRTTPEDRYHTLICGLCASLGLGYLVESAKMLGQNNGENVIVPIDQHGKCITNIEYNMCKPWQNIEVFVNNSLQTLSHRPRGCMPKLLSHKHVTHILYVALGFQGSKVFVRSRMDAIS